MIPGNNLKRDPLQILTQCQAFFCKIWRKIKRSYSRFHYTVLARNLVQRVRPALGGLLSDRECRAARTLRRCSLHTAVACTAAGPRPADTWEQPHLYNADSFFSYQSAQTSSPFAVHECHRDLSRRSSRVAWTSV